MLVVLAVKQAITTAVDDAIKPAHINDGREVEVSTYSIDIVKYSTSPEL